MNTLDPPRQTAPLGELIAAVFDDASRYSTDPREVSRLVAQVVAHMLASARPPRPLPSR